MPHIDALDSIADQRLRPFAAKPAETSVSSFLVPPLLDDLTIQRSNIRTLAQERHELVAVSSLRAKDINDTSHE